MPSAKNDQEAGIQLAIIEPACAHKFGGFGNGSN
jgi:hypothetical protein